MTSVRQKPVALPIKIDSTSNGEYLPQPLPLINQQGNHAAAVALESGAKRLGLSRRDMLKRGTAVVTTLAAFNAVNAKAGRSGGFFAVTEPAQFDEDLAQAEIGGDEFVFDVQGHYVVPGSLAKTLKPRCADANAALSREYMRCLGADAFIKDIFMDSDTQVMVLSFIPSHRAAEPLTVAEAAATQAIVDELEGQRRLLIHGRVNPNQDGDLADMDELAERWRVSAWKCYTQWGPDGNGFYLHDEDTGIAMIEKARRLGIRTVCVHKGIPFGRRSYEHSLCTDVGVVASRYPDVNFLVYHSGYIPGQVEGPYRPQRGEGVDELIASVERNGLGPGSNVYAELGSTWRMLMRDPEQAAHCLGKLLRHLGPDNVLYGSDCVWYGSPQDQIQALRTFQISEEFQDRFGYPAITPQLRARLLGLNAAAVYKLDLNALKTAQANDPVAKARENYREDPSPHFETYGPKTRREFFALKRAMGDMPG